MGMTKKFVYAAQSGIVFCPDDVLYLEYDSYHDWNSTHDEYVPYSELFFKDSTKSVSFESKYFDEIKDILINNCINKEIEN